MTARADATLAAIVARLAERSPSADHGAIYPDALAAQVALPATRYMVERALLFAGYAVLFQQIRPRVRIWRLTPAGLAAVDAARAAAGKPPMGKG